MIDDRNHTPFQNQSWKHSVRNVHILMLLFVLLFIFAFLIKCQKLKVICDETLKREFSVQEGCLAENGSLTLDEWQKLLRIWLEHPMLSVKVELIAEMETKSMRHQSAFNKSSKRIYLFLRRESILKTIIQIKDISRLENFAS